VESVGLSVRRLQLTGLLTSGLLAGLAGVYLSLGQLNFFNPNMTSGRGYIALAAMIFGNWRPVPVAAAAFLFGYTDAVQIALQNKGYDIPSDFLISAPYVITLIALAGAVGNTRPPASIGKILGGQTRD
jgi:simple sugar transport system permease protein